jgi:hypothetical protein
MTAMLHRRSWAADGQDRMFTRARFGIGVQDLYEQSGIERDP